MNDIKSLVQFLPCEKHRASPL